MFWAYFQLVQCLAINIPKTVSMEDLKKLDPEDSLLNVFWNGVLHYRWIIIGAAFFVITSIVILLMCKSNSSSKDKEGEEDEEEISLQGRKLLLPHSECFNRVKKYYLSEDFPEIQARKMSDDIYQETLITQLKLPTT